MKFTIKMISLFSLLFFFSHCAYGPSMHSSYRSYQNTQQKPLEYYSQVKPASFTAQPKSEPDELRPDTKGDKARNVIIGTLAGLALVAGIVVPVLVLKK